MSDAVAGVVLAAGLSSRMGTNKMLLELGGKTVLRRAVETAIAAKLSPLLVVLGNERQRAEHELRGLDCTPLFNPDFAQGMNTSLRAGISAMPDNVAGALVMLADMPFVTAAMIDELLRKWRAAKPPLAVSLYGDVLAPPTLYGRELFAELRALEGDGCGKRVVKRHRAEALEVSWPPAALTDLDVPDDFARVRAQIEGA
jgi:molybdenum cofactor cytidylyltransferase